MRGSFMKRLLSVILVIAMVAMYAVPVYAADDEDVGFELVDNDRVSASLFDRESVELPEEETTYADHDVVRVSIMLEKAATLEAGYSTLNIADNYAAMNYRESVEKDQANIVDKIEEAIEEELDVVWNLTLAANLISAYVEYGQIGTIEGVDGVEGVVIETRYEPDVVSTGAANPDMATSSAQIGSSAMWAAGYTGAGSKVAIIDTGLDLEHEAFDAAALEYSLSQLDGEFDLMDASDIEAVLGELNAYKRAGYDAEDMYVNAKVPFGFNYVDEDLDIIHLNDGQGEHGSHVAGIAAANAYVANGDGTYAYALDTTFVQGVAPDAQLLIMKVFGKNGGAYDSDYMAAIEDAVILGADSVNLSLGSGNPGFSTATGSSEELGAYQEILDNLEKSGVVVAFSAGNSGYWSENAESGLPYLYLDDVSFQTDGSPGSFTNAFTVASVDNDGYVASYFVVADTIVSYNDYQNDFGNAPMTTLAGTKEYVFVNAIGTPEDFAAVGSDVLAGKIVMCYRGETSFYEKANAAVAAGAAGVVIVNNQEGIINMDLTDYSYTAPVVSLQQVDGEIFKRVSMEYTTESGLTYWTGSMEIADSKGAFQYNSNYYTMSSFSSWGVPGSLELKPEITAPGGSIYSVAGANVTQGQLLFGNHKSYEVMSGTSMASPQVAGMAALMAQYVRETGLDQKTGLDARTLTLSLLMSTAVPMLDGNSGNYYPVIQQGAGLANVGAAASADSYILMGADATDSYADGKVKAELGDDPSKTGVYSFSFTINNLTDARKTYVLSADVFTQGAFSYEGILLLDTWTTDLIPEVVWTVDGKAVSSGEELVGLDFNGDGAVNSKDGMILLEYATGMEVTLSNADKADLDADGEIDSYDAYLFLDMLSAGGAVVPANGSAEVTVTITLGERDRAWLANYENGAYIQAYVYAESLSTEEGVAGTTHSIPVLGFYGNWSDASMFDKGSFVEYNYGMESRPPYLYSSVFQNGNYNGLLIQYSDMSGNYWFGGNPMVPDETYMPERNAISAVRGDQIAKIGFTAIRNAADSYFQVINTETGEAYINESVGSLQSAYYYVNGGYWNNTYYTLNAGFTPDEIPEGTTIDVGLALIPEYYLDAEGNVNWAALGDGVTFSMPMVIDNTAPTLNDVDIDVDDNVLEVVATDNQYIAAVALYDIYGQYLYTFTGADADQAAGDTVEFVLDLSEVDGSSFLLQVYDYALNTVTYEIEIQLGEVTDVVDDIELSSSALKMTAGTTKQLTAIVYPVNATNRNVVWSSSDETVATVDENGVVTAVAAGNAVITATSEADATVSADCAVSVFQLDSTLYGVLQDAEGTPVLFSWNLATDNTWTAGAEVEPYVENVAYDAYRDTMFVQDSATMKMFQLDPATGETIAVSTGAAAFGAPNYDMAVSPLFGDAETSYLFGVYGGYLLGPVENLANTFTSGWNLASYLTRYTGASKFVAICDYGYDYDAETNTYSDVYLALDNSGTLWTLYYDGTSSIGLGFIPTDLDLPYTMYAESQYCSLISDENGDLFLSHFTGETNEIYYLTFSSATRGFESLYVGNVGADVWPAALYMAETNAAGAAESFEANVALIKDAAQMVATGLEIEAIEAIETEATGSLNSFSGSTSTPVHPMSDVDLGEDEDTVAVNLTVKDLDGASVVSTNGVITVTYDAAALTLDYAVFNCDYNVLNAVDGVITCGYVDLDGMAADEVVATLYFTVNTDEDTTVTVTTDEVNADKSGYEEELLVELACRHNYEAVVTPPTCTEEGYTTYTCEHCGDTYVGDYVEAHGHNVVMKESKPATCTTNGYEYYACEHCGGQEYQIILEATGHKYENGKCTVCGAKDPNANGGSGSWFGKWFGFWWGAKCDHSYDSVVIDPTCTNKGYTAHTCSKCGDCYKDAYTDALGHEYADGVCERCGHQEPTKPNQPGKPGWGSIWDWLFGKWH